MVIIRHEPGDGLYTVANLKLIQKEKEVSEEEVITFMVENINEINRALCEQHGMDKELVEQQIEQGYASMVIVASSLYNKMKEANLIA
jgi:hypothetical protein